MPRMQSSIEKSRSMNWRRLRAELSILLMLFAIALPGEATTPVVGSAIDEGGPQSATAELIAIEGAIEKVRIEYGVKVKGETGIRIHTKFSVKGALNVACSVQATVERADGKSMLSKSVGTVYQDGKKLLVLSTFTPPYDPATYPDTKLFIPYWALNLQAENPNKMRLNVVLVGEAKQFARSVMDFGLALGKAR
ncbi:hypothetical protein BH20ACI2_BH20ACI2_22830 [soil metagenome]